MPDVVLKVDAADRGIDERDARRERIDTVAQGVDAAEVRRTPGTQLLGRLSER